MSSKMGPRWLKTLDQYTQQEFRELNIPGSRVLSNVRRVEVEPITTTNHSRTFKLQVHYRKGRGKKPKVNPRTVLAKQYFTPVGGSQSYKERRNPDRLSGRELRSTTQVYKLWGSNYSLAPKVFGRATEEPIVLFEFIEGVTDKELLIAARGDEDARKRIIETSVRKMAALTGMLAPYSSSSFKGRNPFAFTLSEERDRREVKIESLRNYLSTIVAHDLRIQGVELPSTNSEREEHIRREVLKSSSLAERVARLVDLESGLGEERFLLQHGDSRVHHVIRDEQGNIKFIDYEQFGLHPFGHDLGTYTSAEGGISRLAVGDLPRVLSLLHAYELEGLNNQTDRSRRRSLKKLDGMSADKIVGNIKGVRVSDLATYLASEIRENLHLDATNKAGTGVARAYQMQGIPGYTEEEMFEARLARVGEVLGTVRGNTLLWGYADRTVRDAIQQYFGEWERLFDDLQLDLHTSTGRAA